RRETWSETVRPSRRPLNHTLHVKTTPNGPILKIQTQTIDGPDHCSNCRWENKMAESAASATPPTGGGGRGGLDNDKSSSISVSAMQFSYDSNQAPLFFDFNLDIAPGSRCLLTGANGSGKSTLLRILAGKHMVGGKDVVRVLNSSAFHDTQLVCSGDLAYLGGSWSKNAGSAGEIPLQGDFSAEHMIFGVEGVDPDRREKLIELLDIDLRWRMHKVSDGQRRRVQICMGLLYPYKVLLLDEVTVDLDVVARMDLLEFFREETEQRGATLIYATHIFDGLEAWATHLAYIQEGELKRYAKLLEMNELSTSVNLLTVVENWLRSETKQEKRKKKEVIKPCTAHTQKASSPSPFMSSSRHMAYYR
ncbi:unnamed protein product, partial [Linum tenue]